MIEVGQRVIVEYLKPNIRPKGSPRYSWTTVTKVGRLYFEVSDVSRGSRFKLENLYEDSQYGASYVVHLNLGALFEKISKECAMTKLRRLFCTNSFTTKQILSACSALGLTEEVNAELIPKINQLQEELNHE